MIMYTSYQNSVSFITSNIRKTSPSLNIELRMLHLQGYHFSLKTKCKFAFHSSVFFSILFGYFSGILYIKQNLMKNQWFIKITKKSMWQLMSTELVLGLNCQIVNYVNIVLTSLSTLASFLDIFVKYITHQIEIQLIILYAWQIVLRRDFFTKLFRWGWKTNISCN